MKDYKLYIFFGELLTLGAFLMPYYGMGDYSIKLLDDTSSYVFFFIGLLSVIFEIANKMLLASICSGIIAVEMSSVFITGLISGATVGNYGPAIYCSVIGCMFVIIVNIIATADHPIFHTVNKRKRVSAIKESDDNLEEY